MFDQFAGSLLFILNLLGSVRGESTPSAVATTSAEVKKNDIQAWDTVFVATQKHALSDLEVKRASFAASLSSVTDEKKRLRIETVLSRLNEINKLQTTLFLNTLKRLQIGLNEIQKKADAYGKETGTNTPLVYTRIAEANSAIADALSAVTKQAGKIYSLTLTSGSIKESYQKVRAQMFSDLKDVRNQVQNVRTKVTEALSAYRSSSGKTDTIRVPTASASAVQP